jgi:hypothetical protein
LDRLGTRAEWTQDPPGEALRRSKDRFEKAIRRFGASDFATSFYVADFSSSAAQSSLEAGTTWAYVDLSGAVSPVISRFEVQVPSPPAGVIGFSDTIIAWREIGKTDMSAFERLCNDVIDFFNATLVDGDFYRGVISVGQFLPADHAIFGPAVQEAGDWYEAFDWMGVSLTPSAEWFVRSSDRLQDLRSAFVEFDLSPKGGAGHSKPPQSVSRVALAWPRFLSGGRGELLGAFRKQLVSRDFENKYRNTLRFFEDSIAASS